MSNTTPPTSASSLIANDTRYEVVPRRRFERRSVNDRQVIKPELAAENEDMQVEKSDKKNAAQLRIDERRQSDRRTSRPTLLSVDEITTLRKK